MPKSWNEKFESKPTHDIKVIEKDFWSQKAGDRMLIPTPKLIEDYVNQSEKGTARQGARHPHGRIVRPPKLKNQTKHH